MMQLTHHNIVPNVALWTSERNSMKTIMLTERGVIGKRDKHGIYWAQYGNSQGVGDPVFGEVHTERQVAAMRGPLCQVCGNKLEYPFHWILNRMDAELLGQEFIATQTPPVCKKCISIALKNCPHLISMGDTVPILQVNSYTCVGAIGELFVKHPEKCTLEPEWKCVKYNEKEKLKFFVGRQLVVKIQDWKLLNINQFK